MFEGGNTTKLIGVSASVTRKKYYKEHLLFYEVRGDLSRESALKDVDVYARCMTDILDKEVKE